MALLILSSEQIHSRSHEIEAMLEPLSSDRLELRAKIDQIKRSSSDFKGQKRTEALREIKGLEIDLKTLPGKFRSGPKCQALPGNQNLIIVATDSNERLTSFDYSETRFRTIKDHVFGHYHEIWKPSVDNDRYYLHQAYLHIYEYCPRTFNYKELLLLHSDPNLDPSEAHYEYKRVPHLHVKVARGGIEESHIALNLLYANELLTSTTSFTEAMSLGIRMIKDQVLMQLKIPIWFS